MGGPEGPGKIDTKSVEADLKAAQERDKKKAEASTKKESYDAFDVVVDYLFETAQVDTLSEASYVMMEMDSDTIQSIILEQAGHIADEYDFIVEGLIAEGYDLSEYTEEEFIDMLIAENILPAIGKLIVGINKARKMATAVAKSPATKQLGQTVKKAASDFGKGFKAPLKIGGMQGKGGAITKATKPGALTGTGGRSGAPTGSLTATSGRGGALVKSPGGKMVDASIKPVKVSVETPKAPKLPGSTGKAGGLVKTGTTATGVAKAAKGAAAALGKGGRGGKAGLVAAGLLGAGALGAGLLAQGRTKKEAPRRKEGLVGSQNLPKPLKATPDNMAVAGDVNKKGGLALGKGGLGYLAKSGDKMVIKQAKAIGADDGIIGKAARKLGLTKAKDKALEAQRQAVGRSNREKYLSGQGLTDKNITGYQAKGAKRRGEDTGFKFK